MSGHSIHPPVSRLDIAKDAASAGGAIVLKYFKEQVEFKQKADKTYVSVADEESEAAIKRIIVAAYPGDSINGEETGITAPAVSGTEGGHVWHVDPLDGTANFKCGLPYSCISIGVEERGEFVIGVIYNPFSGELYWAERGKGAYCNGERIHVSGSSVSDGWNLVDASFKDDRAKRKLRYIGALLGKDTPLSSKARMIGSNALQLAEVARGSCVTSISDAIHSYDFAAGIVIVREAGGVVSDQYGNPPTIRSTVVLAANKKENLDIIVAIARDAYDGYNGM